MELGATIGEACATFAVTNIDDLFVLVTFNAEASTSRTMTPLKIFLGQLLGFTVIVAISMIGFGISLVLPPEPIGFLGLLPIVLGLWKFFQLFYDQPEDDTTPISTAAAMKGIFKVALITIMNGGDNIGTYIPLFAQVERAAIAVYIVVYYILLCLWCLGAWLIMRQRHILALVQKYVDFILPLLYTGLGIFIVVKSNCYPWTIDKINEKTKGDPGEGTMAGVTTFVLLATTCAMAWITVGKRRIQTALEEELPGGGARSSVEGTTLGDVPASPGEGLTPTGDVRPAEDAAEVDAAPTAETK